MKKIIGLAFIAALALTACDKEKVDKDRLTTKRNFENKELTIELVNVNDSRCPEEVICVWQGDAAVDLKVSDNSSSQLITLHTYYSDKVDTTIFGYQITLEEVSPYPQNPGELELEDYKIDLKVEKQ